MSSVFIHRIQILGKHLVEQGMRPLYLFDKEAFGSTSCFWFVCSSLTLQPEAPVTIYEPGCRIFEFPCSEIVRYIFKIEAVVHSKLHLLTSSVNCGWLHFFTVAVIVANYKIFVVNPPLQIATTPRIPPAYNKYKT